MSSHTLLAARDVDNVAVEGHEFFKLLLSRRTLYRSDDAARRLRGLYDPESGTRYIIHEDELFRRAAF